MAATKFIKNAFAVSGDKSAIPDATQPSGVVSYAQGFGQRYEENLATNPSALPMPRDQFNQLMFDITLGLQQYQSIGVPNFISTSDNGGSPFSYAKYALARYDDGVNGERNYQSLVASNTALPTDTTKWRLIDDFGDALIFPNATFDASVNDGDVVYWNGTEYDQAVANGTSAQNAIGIADVTNGRVYAFGSVPALLAGLTPGSVYYLSTATPGAVTTVIPMFNRVRIGVAKSATVLLLQPAVQPDSLPVAVVSGNVQSITGGAGDTFYSVYTVTSDPFGLFDTGDNQFVIPKNGLWKLSLADLLVFGGIATAIYKIYVNGSAVRVIDRQTVSADTVFNGTIPLVLFAGDLVELSISTTVTTNSNPFFTLEYTGNG
jgi:hypothetical protein